MSDEEPNYQKRIDPYPPLYDVFLGYRRWDDNNAKPKKAQPPKPKPKPQPCVCPPQPPKQCPTEPTINVYIHLLPGNGGRRIRHFTPEKFKSSSNQTQVTTKKTPFQISGDLAEEYKTVKNGSDKNDFELKVKGKEIQKALSCDFKKSCAELDKREKPQKSVSGIGKKVITKQISVPEKKTKSGDYFQDTRLKISSQTSLLDREPENLSRKKLISELGLSLKALEKAHCKYLLDNHKRALNVFTENSKKIWKNEQLPEKSISFQHFLFPHSVKKLCKSVSSETRSLDKGNRNSCSLEQYKNSLIAKLEELPKPDVLRSPTWRHTVPSEHMTNLRNILNRRNSQILNRCHSVTKPECRFRISGQNSRVEKVINQSSEALNQSLGKSDESSDPARKYNNQTWQQSSVMKKNLKICQCPHFHTEEGIKTVCLQSSEDAQEYGQKFFRVNYIPKEELNDSDDEKEYADKGTTTDEEPVRLKPKIIKCESKKSTTFKSKEPEVARKESQRISKPKMMFTYNQKKGTLAEERVKSPTKTVRKVKQESGKEKEVKSSDNAAMTEAETLRKLFSKLNSVERLLKTEKRPKKPGTLSGKIPQKERMKEMTDNDEEDEIMGNSKDLKSEIVHHIQNWLNAEFTEPDD